MNPLVCEELAYIEEGLNQRMAAMVIAQVERQCLENSGLYQAFRRAEAVLRSGRCDPDIVVIAGGES